MNSGKSKGAVSLSKNRTTLTNKQKKEAKKKILVLVLGSSPKQKTSHCRSDLNLPSFQLRFCSGMTTNHMTLTWGHMTMQGQVNKASVTVFNHLATKGHKGTRWGLKVPAENQWAIRGPDVQEQWAQNNQWNVFVCMYGGMVHEVHCLFILLY